jgi:hypothetical protein
MEFPDWDFREDTLPGGGFRMSHWILTVGILRLPGGVDVLWKDFQRRPSVRRDAVAATAKTLRKTQRRAFRAAAYVADQTGENGGVERFEEQPIENSQKPLRKIIGG